MAEKKYVSLDNLETYDSLIKNEIKEYTDSTVAQKTQVQIITWEDDD